MELLQRQLKGVLNCCKGFITELSGFSSEPFHEMLIDKTVLNRTLRTLNCMKEVIL